MILAPAGLPEELLPDDRPLPGHSFPLWLIAFLLDLVLDATALRAVSRVGEVLHAQFPWLFPEPPHWTTCRLWLLRLGLHLLTRPKEQATDWIWFLDLEAPAGGQKCLVVGLRRAHLPPPGEALQLRHLEPIALVPCERSTKETVLQELQRHVQVTGAPEAIVSDLCRRSWRFWVPPRRVARRGT